MRASLTEDWVFLANPRCGSTSLRAALTPFADLVSRGGEGPIRDHWTASEAAAYFAKIRRELAMFAVFTTVRNPWARAASAYMYGEKNPASVWWRTRREAPAFDEFIRHRNVSARLFDLAAFASIDGQRAVGHVFAIERLEEGMAVIRGIVRRPVTVPVLNQSAPYDYRAFYADADVDWIAQQYACEIAAMGYSFDTTAPTTPFLGPP